MGTGPCKVLLIGFGNPGRLDDGLGPALAAGVEEAKLANVTIDSDYQLTVEDAAVVAEHDVVVFADAACTGPEPFSFDRIQPQRSQSFSSHSVEPAAVLALAEDLFHSATPGYMLGIRGYEFNEYREFLTDKAKSNLAAALNFIVATLEKQNFEEAVAQTPSASDEGVKCKTENT